MWRLDEPIIMGVWKFRDVVPTADLREVGVLLHSIFFARDLYIRKTSKNQIGLGFTIFCRSDERLKEKMDSMIATVTDLLKRKFGNDFVGYDIASPVTSFYEAEGETKA